MIKLIIFDFDGVVADTFDAGVNIWSNIAKKEHFEQTVTASDFKSLGFKGLIKKFNVPFYKVPMYIHLVRKNMSSQMYKIKSFPGMKAVLLKLKQKHKLVLVTSNSKQNVNVFLQKNHMEGIFDFAIAGVSVFGKASHMKKAIKTAKVKNREVICVGDEDRDVEAAKKLKLAVVCVTWGFNSRKLLQKGKPDYLVSKPIDLVRLMNRIK